MGEVESPTSPGYSWRNLIGGRSPSDRRFSSGGDDKRARLMRRRRPGRSHTMDNTATDINDQSLHLEAAEKGDVITGLAAPVTQTPPKAPLSRGSSLLQRFLASTARRRSQTAASTEGSTVSRSTDDELEFSEMAPNPRARRATMDTEMPSMKLKPAPEAGAKPLEANGVAEGSRRATMDMGQASSHSRKGFGSGFGSSHARRRGSRDSAGQVSNQARRRGSRDSLQGSSNGRRHGSRENLIGEGEDPALDEKEYTQMQAQWQRRADDLHKSGQIEEAIKQWEECLELAEENKDTLANKTEIICILVDLHLQEALRHRAEIDPDEAGMGPEDAAWKAKYHHQTAKRYVHRVKPALFKPQWFSNSKPLMDFLVEAEAWELAILVAEQLGQMGTAVVEPEQLATIHFQIASQKLDSHRQGEALQHLQATVKQLQQLPEGKRDMTMYLQVLQLLSTEYKSQGQFALALEACQEQLDASPSEKHASLYCQMAQIYITTQKLDDALEKLEAAASTLDESEPTIRLELLQTKGDVFFRLGRMEDSLEVYQLALKEVVNPAEKAKLLFTLGRLCVRLTRIRPAISYFTREMEITQAELGVNHLSVSRVLHELAKLYDEGLGEHKMALMKLHKALQIELAVLQECHYAITQCPKCNPVTHRMCPNHANLQRDVSNQIRETKKAQGRLHFKLGDFEKALKTSFDGTERRGGERRHVGEKPSRSKSSDF